MYAIIDKIAIFNGGWFMKGKYIVGIIAGAFMTICGFIATNEANATIDSNWWRYTWSPPYSNFEQKTLFIKYLGILLIICGVVDVIVALVKYLIDSHSNCTTASADKKNNIKTVESCDMFTICSKCGEMNGKNNMHCFKCGNSLITSKQPKNIEGWVCPQCNKENMNYVGTCGCGQVKPK